MKLHFFSTLFYIGLASAAPCTHLEGTLLALSTKVHVDFCVAGAPTSTGTIQSKCVGGPASVINVALDSAGQFGKLQIKNTDTVDRAYGLTLDNGQGRSTEFQFIVTAGQSCDNYVDPGFRTLRRSYTSTDTKPKP